MANAQFQSVQKGRVIEDAVHLLLGGKAYHGWERVEITESMTSIANTFRLGVFDKFDGLRSSWPFIPGTSVRINIGQEQALTGRIEKLDVNYGGENHGFEVSGRSNSGDLVDCSHLGDLEFKSIRLDRLAEKLIQPFGMNVQLSVLESDLPVIDFSVKPSELVFNALNRAARNAGYLWVSTRGGNIRLTRAGAFRGITELHQDVNIIGGSASYDESERHSQYIIKGQSVGLDDFFGDDVSAPEGSATDAGITRYRPLIVTPDGNVTSGNATTRAAWEASNRVASSTRISVKVRGWRQEDGTLWGANQLHRVKSTFLGVNAEMLTESVVRSLSNGGGTTTTLNLVPKNAFDVKPEINKNKEEDIMKSLGAEFG